MNEINIITPGGFGDAFTYSSVIKNKYCNEYDIVNLNVPRVNRLYKVLYNDTPNVRIGPNPNAPTKRLRWQDCVEDWDSWRKVDWNREMEKEQACYDHFVERYGDKYNVIHWRGRNNAGEQMVNINPEHYENQELPVINLDADWLKANDHPIHDITDYRLLIEKAQEVHMYEGNFSSLVAGLELEPPFYLHLYCKRELFNPNKVHHDCIKFINEGKWMKDNVNVTYLFDYEKK